QDQGLSLKLLGQGLLNCLPANRDAGILCLRQPQRRPQVDRVFLGRRGNRRPRHAQVFLQLRKLWGLLQDRPDRQGINLVIQNLGKRRRLLPDWLRCRNGKDRWRRSPNGSANGGQENDEGPRGGTMNGPFGRPPVLAFLLVHLPFYFSVCIFSFTVKS